MKQPLRFCTICRAEFRYTPRPGRPPSFCSTRCKTNSRRIAERFCVICGTQFTGKGNPYGPFYCSEECQAIRGLCFVCGKATNTSYCSHACLYTEHPLPWECKVCKKAFRPSKHWLAKEVSLRHPEYYCSAACYEAQTSSTAAAIAGRLTTQRLKYRDQMSFLRQADGWSPTPQNNLIFLPLQPNGTPFTGIPPEELYPFSKLPATSKNTIRFWDYVCNETEFLTDLTAEEYNAYVVHHIGILGTMPFMDVPILPGMTLWPYLEPYFDEDRYEPRTCSAMFGNYRYYLRLALKRADAPDLTAVQDLMFRAEASSQIMEHYPSFALDEKFRSAWRVPQRWLPDGQSKLQFKVRQHWTIVGSVQPQHYLLTNPALEEKLFVVNQPVIEFATKHQNLKNTAKYPWGPNCYAAMADEVSHDNFTRRMQAVNYGEYNYPPEGKAEALLNYQDTHRKAMKARIAAQKDKT